MTDDNTEDFLSKLCEYLKSLGYDQDTINRVEKSKVSVETFKFFKKEDFMAMGLAVAHAYQIIEKFSNNKTRLKQLMDNARKRPEQKRRKKCELSITITWYDFDKKKNRFVQVRAPKGGGIRQLQMSRVTPVRDVLDKALDIFFPRGKSRKGCNVYDYSSSLGDFSQTEIDNLHISLESYMEQFGFRELKFCLMTKELTGDYNNKESTSDNESLNDDFELPVSPTDRSFVAENAASSLQARRRLIREQDDEFKASLEGDRKKIETAVIDLEEKLEEEKNKVAAANQQRVAKLKLEIAELTKKENIRKARSERVLPEPELVDDCVVCFVQHVSIGKVQRLFRPVDTAQAIYDWIGSLCPEPIYFKLCPHLSTIPISLETKIASIERTILNMIETDEPIQNAADDSVTFLGHHVDLEHHYEELDKKRIQMYDELSQTYKNICVSRENVFEDLMKLFRKRRDIMGHRIKVQFENEAADGDGVAREAYSLYMNQLLFKCFEGNSQFVPLIHPEFGEEEFTIVGKILFVFFLNFGVFPIQISNASLEYALFGSCRDSTLLDSFFSYCSNSHSSIIRKAIRNECFVQEEIIEVISAYGIRTMPTKNNISDLICRVAKNEMITKPWTALLCIRDAFTKLFGGLKRETIAAIYEVSIPTQEKLLQHIQFPDAVDQIEEKAFSFIRRYIEESNQATLKTFLQYVTGSSFILPDFRIGISSKLMNELETRPISKICIKSLIIPRNIPTYHAFKINMDFYLNHNELWAMED